MRFNSLINSFSSGEISRLLKGRTNIEEFSQGAEEITNFLPLPEGGVMFRPGTFTSQEFIFGSNLTEQWFTAEFTPGDGITYLVGLNPGGATPIRIGRLGPSGGLCTVTKPDFMWNTRPDFADGTADYTPGADHRELVEQLQFAQSGDTMIIVDGTGQLAPIVIFRTGIMSFIADSFIIPSITNANTGLKWIGNPPFTSLRLPYKDTNIDANLKLKPSATSGICTITSEDASAVAKDFFQGDVVGMYIKISHGSTTGVALVVNKLSDSQVSANILVNFGATTASTSWEVSAWNPVDGYPRSVCFFEQRLVFGGNKTYSDTIWCSLTANIYHFMQRRLLQDSSTNASGLNYFGDIKSTDPFSFVPANSAANSIQWLFSSDTLLVGTSGEEFSITGGSENALSLESIQIKGISSHGSSKVKPVKAGTSLLFVSFDGRKIHEIPKNLEGYKEATNLLALSTGIIDKSIDPDGDFPDLIRVRNQVKRIAWDESRSVLWCLCKNQDYDAAGLISLTLNRSTKCLAWAKHYLVQNPYITSLTCVSEPENGNSPKLYLFLKRTGATYYSLEFISPNTNEYDEMELGLEDGGVTEYYEPKFPLRMDAGFFPLSAVSGDNIPIDASYTNTFAAGTEYSVFAKDGSGDVVYLGAFTPTGANLVVTDADTYTDHIIGVIYEGELTLLPPEAGAQFGTAQGMPRRVHEFVVGLDRSAGGSYKGKQAGGNPFDLVSSSQGSPSSLFSGEIAANINCDPKVGTQVTIKQTQPYPMTVLWINQKGYTHDQ